MERPWECRFLDRDCGFLPVYAKAIARKVAKPNGPWTKHLRPSARGVVRIDRKISANLEFFVFSNFYSLAEYGRRLMDAPVDELENANFGKILPHELPDARHACAPNRPRQRAGGRGP